MQPWHFCYPQHCNMSWATVREANVQEMVIPMNMNITMETMWEKRSLSILKYSLKLCTSYRDGGGNTLI